MADPAGSDRAGNGGRDGDRGRFAYDGLDRVIHEKARLGLLTSLVPHRDGLTFGDLKQLCELTDGNLSRHLQVLEEAGLIAIDKSFVANRPQTRCRMTDDGRARFGAYLAVLEQVVRDAVVSEQAARPARGSEDEDDAGDALAPA